VPDFVKSLDVSRVMDDPNLLVAHQMNGQPLRRSKYRVCHALNSPPVEVVPRLYEVLTRVSSGSAGRLGPDVER